MNDFKSYPKILRLENESITITEKIDGTNGLICIWKDEYDVSHIKAGCRSRWLTDKDHNFNFHHFVMDNAVELIEKLGKGYHYGEWYGQSINRNYGLKEKRFALFNAYRWSDPEVRPKCCGVVPVINTVGNSDISKDIKRAIDTLWFHGSFVADFAKPEGLVVVFNQTQAKYKIIIDE